MKKIVTGCVILIAACSLTACSNYFASKSSATAANPLDQPIATSNSAGGPLGGSLASGMDEIDLSKVARALDKAPGTETKWTNALSGKTYSIKPVQKINVSGYQFCRSYSFSVEKNGNAQQMNSRACIGKDGNWQDVG
jgi:surface antigen